MSGYISVVDGFGQLARRAASTRQPTQHYR
jgi:hypothetical protein